MNECPACKHRDMAWIGRDIKRIGDDFIVISRDLKLLACPECECVIYDSARSYT